MTHVADVIIVYRTRGAEVDRLAYALAVERPEDNFGVVAINVARGDDLLLAFAVAIKIDVQPGLGQRRRAPVLAKQFASPLTPKAE